MLNEDDWIQKSHFSFLITQEIEYKCNPYHALHITLPIKHIKYNLVIFRHSFLCTAK